MTAAGRIAAFVVVLAAVFATAYGLGAALLPDAAPAPEHGSVQDHDGGAAR